MPMKGSRRGSTTLLRFSNAVADLGVTAGVVGKAADLKEQAERPRDATSDDAPEAAGG